MPVSNLAILVKMSGGLLPPNSRAGDVEIYDNGRMLIFESDTDIVERQIDRQKVLEILQSSREAGFFQLPNIIHDSGSSPNVPDVTLSIVDAMGNNTVTMTSYQRLKGEMRKSPFDLIYKRITDLAWESYTNGAAPSESAPAPQAPVQNAPAAIPANPQMVQPAPPTQNQVPPLPFSKQGEQNAQPNPGFDLPSLDDLLQSSGLQFDAPTAGNAPSLPPLNPQAIPSAQNNQRLPPLNQPMNIPQQDDSLQLPSLDSVFKQQAPQQQPRPPKQQQTQGAPQQQTPQQPVQQQNAQQPPQQKPKQPAPAQQQQKRESPQPQQQEQRPQPQAPQQEQRPPKQQPVQAAPQQRAQPLQPETQRQPDAPRPNDQKPRQEPKPPAQPPRPPQEQRQPPEQRQPQEQRQQLNEPSRPQREPPIEPAAPPQTPMERPQPRAEQARPQEQRPPERENRPPALPRDERRPQPPAPQGQNAQPPMPPQRKPPVAWERTQESIERLEESLHGKVLVFYAAKAKLGMEDMRYLYSHLRKLGRKKSLYVIPFIEDTDSTVVWRMATLIREFCEELHVILPEESTMPTTMFSLAADSILMNPFGFLSPIETNFSHSLWQKSPDSEPTSVPLSEVFQAAAIPVNAKSGKLKDDGPTTTDSSQSTFHPLVTAAASRQYALTQRICTNLLKLSSKNKRSDAEIAKIVTQLTQGYPSAHYPIVYFEAQTLGLPVSETNESVNDVLWDLVKEYVYITQPVIHYQGETKLFEKQNIIIESTGRRTIHYSEQMSEGNKSDLIEEHTRWRELTQQISVNAAGKESHQLLWKELQLVGSNED